MALKTDWNYIKEWIKDIQKIGRISFSRKEIVDHFPDLEDSGISSALRRLTIKNEIVSVWKSFYVIIPLKYALRKMVPPVLYIDDLMKYLNRPYYVGLLNAAAFYGAAHQQPQEFFVLSPPPALRDTSKKGIKINFISRKEIPGSLIQSFKTETGYVWVSSPELTAADLITYQKDIGGLNRAATVLNELASSIRPDALNKEFFDHVPVSSIQRLGFLLDHVLDEHPLASILLAMAKGYGCSFQKIPLKSGIASIGMEENNTWKIVINEEIEIDE